MHFQREPLERLRPTASWWRTAHVLWQGVDKLRDRIVLQQLWDGDDAPWKVW